MLKEFLCTLGIEKILKNNLKTNDPASFRIHTDDQNLLQMIYQIFGTYYKDNYADELRHDPVLAILGKEALALLLFGCRGSRQMSVQACALGSLLMHISFLG